MAAQGKAVPDLTSDDEVAEHAPESAPEPDVQDTGQSSSEGLPGFRKVQTDRPSERIHILGTGSIGKLVAHSLRSLPTPPPVTLVFHRYRMLQAWREGKKVVTLRKNGYDVARSGFEVELAVPKRQEHGYMLDEDTPSVYDIRDQAEGDVPKPHELAAQLAAEQRERRSATTELDDKEEEKVRKRGAGGGTGPLPPEMEDAVSDEPIYNLILTTKTIHTVSALSAVQHRLTEKSTVCFIQNGMGVIDDVNERIFPNESTRPNYVQGIISHGVNVPPEKAAEDPFYAVHAGNGTLALGLLSRASDDSRSPDSGREDGKLNARDIKRAPFTARYLLDTLSSSPILCAAAFTPSELLQLQLEKLAVNSIMNPLTALIDNRNGHLVYNFPLQRTMRLMLAETSLVIRSLPELRGIPNVEHRFSPSRLEDLVVSVSHKTADNISSMLADVRAGRETEVEYINGYIVKRGEEIDIKCLVNYAIMQTVLGKSLMTRREQHNELPTEEQDREKLAAGGEG